jgi:hypothetical protein
MISPSILHKEWINNRERIIAKFISPFYFSALIAITLVIGCYFFILYQYSVNIPFWDDYSHLKVIVDIIDSNSFIEKIKLLFSLHNEHRIVFARLITLADLILTREVNFFTLIILGNLSLLGIAEVLFLNFSRGRSQDFRWRTIYFLPAILLIFNLSYFEASLWALAALSSLAVIFLSFLCIFILVRSLECRSWWIWPAFFLGVLATFTQGNGLLVLYVGIFLLILQNKFTTSIYWAIGTAITSLLYFYHYKSLDFSPNEIGISSAFGAVLNYLILFLGSWSNIPFIVGIFSLGLFIWLILAGLYRKNIALFGFLTFIFLSALAVASSRYELGIDQALSSRYKIYSLLFFAIIYLSIFEFLEKPWIAKFLRKFPIFLAMLLGINVYITAEACDAMKARKLMLTDGLIAWQQQGKGLTHWDKNIANKIIYKAIQQKIYHPPKFPLCEFC